eukprot:scaffold8779_cov108-Skeletonema_dohrnii-CCMP3373.AAC.1
MCQHCKSGVNHQLATASRHNKQKRYNEKLFVQSCMADLITQCVVCNNRDCDGFKCVVGNDPSGCSCRRCMGFTGTGSGNFHTNTQCRLSVNNTKTKGKSCPFCFMAVGDDIAGSGSLAEHLRLLRADGVLATFVWNSYQSRGGGSQNAVAKTAPLLW